MSILHGAILHGASIWILKHLSMKNPFISLLLWSFTSIHIVNLISFGKSIPVIHEFQNIQKDSRIKCNRYKIAFLQNSAFVLPPFMVSLPFVEFCLFNLLCSPPLNKLSLTKYNHLHCSLDARINCIIKQKKEIIIEKLSYIISIEKQ